MGSPKPFNGKQKIVATVAYNRLDQRIAGQTTVVQAISAHFVRFHQAHFGLDCRRDIGGHPTCGTAPITTRLRSNFLGRCHWP